MATRRAGVASGTLTADGNGRTTGPTTAVPAVPPAEGLRPPEVVAEMLKVASVKAKLPERDMLIRGALAGAFLGFATALAQTIVTQGAAPYIGAIIFPIGFVLLVLMGLELATGNFALLPMGMADRKVSLKDTLRNWSWVYAGNLAGALLFAFMLYVVTTKFGGDGGPLGKLISSVAVTKTTGYSALGLAGWWTALIKGVLANWMVCMGVAMAFISRSTIGRIVAMWLPILTFFALGFEHSIVNMFVIPAGMLFGADVSFVDWWFWNQIPVTIGNIIGGALFTGLALYATYKPAPTT